MTRAPTIDIPRRQVAPRRQTEPESHIDRKNKNCEFRARCRLADLFLEAWSVEKSSIKAGAAATRPPTIPAPIQYVATVCHAVLPLAVRTTSQTRGTCHSRSRNHNEIQIKPALGAIHRSVAPCCCPGLLFLSTSSTAVQRVVS